MVRAEFPPRFLSWQLHTLGFLSSPRLDPESEVAGILMDMYQEMGDVLALQYGGSAAHNMVRRGSCLRESLDFTSTRVVSEIEGD